MSPVHQTIASAFVTVAIYGGLAVGYAAMSIARKFWLIPVWALLQAAAFTLVANIFHAGIFEHRKELEHQLLLSGYVRFLPLLLGTSPSSSSFDAKEFDIFRIQTEMELAREIHRSLVRAFERKLAGYEIFGTSIPSGEVGGDLVDIAESSNEWVSYTADVSGHGVASGVSLRSLSERILYGKGMSITAARQTPVFR